MIRFRSKVGSAGGSLGAGRAFAAAVAVAAAIGAGAGSARAADATVRVGVPTKAFWPTVVAKVAEDRKLFEKEGFKPEITIYKGGAEAFEAVAAGAADVSLVAPTSVATARKRGVAASLVAAGTEEWSGWVLAVKPDAPYKSVKDLAGKKVGITSAGSGSDVLAQAAQKIHGVTYNRVPVGGAGLLPNLANGNLDAIVLYSPLSLQGLRDKKIRALSEFAKELPANLTGGWAALDKTVEQNPKLIQGALNALFGAVAYMRDNPAYAIRMIAENNEVPEDIAKLEYETTFLQLSRDGVIAAPALTAALELAPGGGADLGPASAIIRKVNIVPTK